MSTTDTTERPGKIQEGKSTPAADIPRPTHHSGPATEGNNAKDEKRRRNPLIYVIAGVVILIAAFFGFRAWQYGSTHATTDDAYLTTDVAQVTPQVDGYIQNISVLENEKVTKGEVLAKLDPSTYEAAVQQAKANLAKAIAQAAGANTGVSLTQATGNAQISQAEGGVQQSTSLIDAAIADAQRSAATIPAASAQIQSALAGVQSGEAALSAAKETVASDMQDVAAKQAELASAKAGVLSAESQVNAAQANATKATRDEARYKILLSEDAIAAQQYDAVHATAQSARASLQAAQQGYQQALAAVKKSQADVTAAQQKVAVAQSAVRQAQSQILVDKDAVQSARSMKLQAQASASAAQQQIASAQAARSEAIAKLTEAQTAPKQVLVQQSTAANARAQVLQAVAQLHTAELNLQRTNIVAPFDGHITNKTGQLGEQVSPGQAIMAIVPDNDIFVIANFKETEITHMRAGESVSVSVDAFPNYTFKGTVQSLSPGTGATFSLLPPDNATGNFTKVVQRVPVKIVFDPKQPHLNLLRTGLSVSVAVKL